MRLAFLAFAILPLHLYQVFGRALECLLEHVDYSKSSPTTWMLLFIDYCAMALLMNMFTLVFALMIFVYGTLVDCLSGMLHVLQNQQNDDAESYLMVYSSIVFRVTIYSDCLTPRNGISAKTAVC